MSTDATALVRRALAKRPCGIICDIDGTLSPIASTPDAAQLAPGAADALRRLTDLIDVVAVVSGRAARDAQALVGVAGVLVAGNHGLESLDGDELTMHPDAIAAIPGLKRSLQQIQEWVDGDPALAGVIVEDKGVSGSIHFRMATDRDTAERRLNKWATELAGKFGLKVTHGRMVIELRPPIAINKGAAIRRIVETHHLEGAVFFGDDVTDIDGFNAMQELRDEQGFETWAIGVADPEARPDVIEAADAAIGGVSACVELLTETANELARGMGATS